LELTFTHNADVAVENNPEIQFANGSTKLTFTIPAGSTEAVFAGNLPDAAFRRNVAGTIQLK
jgi:hypothetical protein